MGKYSNFLRETDLFYNLSPLQLEMVDSLCDEKVFREGEMIFPENSPENELYLIFRGQVEIFVDPGLDSANPDALVKPEVIANLIRGQSFGEVALVDQGIRSAVARAALRDTLLLKISHDRLLIVWYLYPELGFRLMYNLAMGLAQKIRNADLMIREVLLNQTRRAGTAR